MNYINRRKKFAENINDNSLVILYSSARKHNSADEAYPFVVNKNFYYLTGIDQDDVYFIMEKSNGKITETLYMRENDPIKIKWVGESLYLDQAKEISGVANAKYLPEFDVDASNLVKKYAYLYLDLEDLSGYKSSANYSFELKKQFEKNINVCDCYPILTLQRGVKEDEEVELLRKDIEITNLALQEVLKHLGDCESENQVQGIFEGSIMYFGNATTSFDTIAASGKNAATLHYSVNNCKLNKDDMILLDLGADCNKYHADISRTYPISGKYSPLQKTIYTIVLECNKYIIDIAKPGMKIKDLQAETIKFLANGCLKAGLIKEYDEIKNYYFHGVSHHIGLDTHDPYPLGRGETVLEKGMIISCEPGLYFEELGIGVRIEDDILITETGCENLSKDIIKEVDEIENFIAKYQK